MTVPSEKIHLKVVNLVQDELNPKMVVFIKLADPPTHTFLLLTLNLALGALYILIPPTVAGVSRHLLMAFTLTMNVFAAVPILKPHDEVSNL
jgi:hypothetical protein